MSGGTGRIKSAQAALSLPPELEEEGEELEPLDLLDSVGLLSFELDSVLLSLFLDSAPLSIFFDSVLLSLFLGSVPLSSFLDSLLPSSELSGFALPYPSLYHPPPFKWNALLETLRCTDDCS